MQKVTELSESPIIGKLYLVPCFPVVLQGKKMKKTRYFPVVGDFHDDVEIGFYDKHVHPDYRFFNQEEYAKTLRYVQDEGQWLYSIVYTSKGDEELRWEPRICMREFPVHPPRLLEWPVLATLEHIYAKSKLVCGVCPHKGANLNSIAPDKHGNKVCPLHNLMWDKDGNLVPRFGA